MSEQRLTRQWQEFTRSPQWRRVLGVLKDRHLSHAQDALRTGTPLPDTEFIRGSAAEIEFLLQLPTLLSEEEASGAEQDQEEGEATL